MFKYKSLPLAIALAGLSCSAIAENHQAENHNGAFDLAVANEFKLIEMLRNSGKISKDASLNDAEIALRGYLKTRQEAERKKVKPTDLNIASKLSANKSKSLTHSMQNGKGNKLGQAKKNAPANMVLENYAGAKRTAKILAILMEFPDFPHNSIQPGESGMYYENYTPEHYAEILFGESGWTAPNGHVANSMKMYYEAQSGDSYSVEGAVTNWYMASKPAAFYGNNDDGDARALIREALAAAAADPSVDLSEFDIEDRFDLDGDGNYWEPDGLVDHVMVFHSSVGEEAGGGQLGEDAIWAHRWNLGAPFAIPGTTPAVDPLELGAMGAYDYTIQPADSAVGVVSHEYAHDLGLPDEYDTEYTGRGEPVSSWSIMSSGSWAGLLGGTEPTGFSAWAKQELQASLGGNWMHGATIHIDDLTSDGVTALIDQAVSKGANNDAIRIDLPAKETVIAPPTSGEYAYFSGSGNDLFNRMAGAVDLTTATSATAKFKAWYDIEADWDYAYVYGYSNGVFIGMLPTSVSTNDDPNGTSRGNGITGNSGGWVDVEIDLTPYAGTSVELYFLYETDGYVANPGLYVDDVTVETDNGIVAMANADDTETFFAYFGGFTLDTGTSYSNHYYLAEWRTHQGIDKGLSHINVAGENMEFSEGLLLWYVDDKYTNNHVGVHPGNGFLGVVDADRHTNTWDDNSAASTRYQIHDATFGLDKTSKLHLDLKASYGISLRDNFTKRNPMFDDSSSFVSDDIPDAGRAVPNYGLKIRVSSQSKDKSVGQILIYK
ncbi:immune inhibitor A domain-containing protein [Colwellia sp. 12G3]|uniref:immune inhibitor A domain-containing protein n=1 Tax=Colwellia sp. 12G3 TaxID=2058299 RepID=UPI000C337FC2|nr:immune inhibitor A domain-containing protein [Colwellia sp. 12G3]PKI17675.1 protease [Colwellia sp. 12G3]